MPTPPPTHRGRRARIMLVVMSLIAAAAAAIWFTLQRADQTTATTARKAPPSSAPTYVGRSTCVECHAAENMAWSGSHHDLAMQEATEQTVLGDFDNVTYNDGSLITTFSRANGQFIVRTDGPDGELANFAVKYTFGVTPLQQYLVELAEGRVQALRVAWDTRPEAEGGQRWFQLYPGETIRHDDPLHWTRGEQNWNYMCAECHSTNVQKNYDAATRRYATTFSEIDVACEACHGPASTHVDWARSGSGESDNGLVVRLNERDGVTWRYDAVAHKPVRSQPRTSVHELDVCAQCHSRRGAIAVHQPGQPIGDSHRVALLDTALYWPDGQIRDEVYEYGSFLQSRMYQHGVTCSDCHDPHSLELRAPGDGVCVQCHAAADFAVESHHHHAPESPGSACVDCHMPARTYMVVDPRRDHSLKIPRPDFSGEMGTPNVCTGCHQERLAAWAAGQLDTWFGKDWRHRPDAAPALHAGAERAAGARAKLLVLAADPAVPGIQRATALERVDRVTSAAELEALRARLKDPDPLVRRAAVAAYDTVPASFGADLVPLLSDPVRDVRLEVVSRVVSIDAASLSPAQRATRDRVRAEYTASQRVNADRAEAHLNLGVLAAASGNTGDAEKDLQRAILIDPHFAPAAVNLADLYRSLGREADAEAVLRKSLATTADVGALYHALGLLLVRTGRGADALEALARAADIEPESARYSYVYAVALAGAGKRDDAIRVLLKSLVQSPNDRETIAVIANYALEAGDRPLALEHATQLVALEPDDPDAVALLESIERRATAHAPN